LNRTSCLGLALLVLGVLALFSGARFLWALRGFVLLPIILILVGLVILRLQRR
jgi:hypothetical protein